MVRGLALLFSFALAAPGAFAQRGDQTPPNAATSVFEHVYQNARSYRAPPSPDRPAETWRAPTADRPQPSEYQPLKNSRGGPDQQAAPRP